MEYFAGTVRYRYCIISLTVIVLILSFQRLHSKADSVPLEISAGFHESPEEIDFEYENRLTKDVKIRRKRGNFLAPTSISDDPRLKNSGLRQALRRVGNYLRMHKYNDYDRRISDNEKKVDHNKELLKAAERKLKDSLDATKFMSDHERTTMKLYFPFTNAKQRFIWRATASYYMCWYTLRKVSVLRRFFARCGSESKTGKDFRANDLNDFECALLSFCPDPCCGGATDNGNMAESHTCRKWSGNPCREVEDGSCWVDLEQNTNFKDMIESRINITCNCNKKHVGFVWDMNFKLCKDEDECFLGEDNCTEEQVCRNTVGSYKCTCRNGYVPDPSDPNVCHRSASFEGLNIEDLSGIDKPKRQRKKKTKVETEDEGILYMLSRIGGLFNGVSSPYSNQYLVLILSLTSLFLWVLQL